MTGILDPELYVFDCDMCLWTPEMYTLYEIPTEPVLGDLNGRGQGVIGVKSGRETVKLFPGALAVLQEYADGKLGQARIAAASSADTAKAVKCAFATMKTLEILPGLTMEALFARGFDPSDGFKPNGNCQIGRSGKLSSNKTSHFRELKKETKIEFDKMVFFDDDGWGDNTGTVARGCPGVITQTTPNGLTYAEFQNAVAKYRRTYPK